MKTNLLIIISFAISLCVNSQVCLTPSGTSPFGASANPYSVTSADFNTDGNADLVVANVNSNVVSVLLGNGAGILAAAINYTVGSSPNSIRSADFNADGNADLASANYSNHNISILLGNGVGSFAPQVNFAVGSFPYSITSDDFNSDGKTDLATANFSSNNISVLLGNGTGSFVPAVNFGAGPAPCSIISADFNADGKIDLVTTNCNSNNVSVLIGDGTGNFAPAVNFPVGILPFSVTSADFNTDGKADLAVANRSSNNISVLLGNGVGNFAPAINFSVGPKPSSIISVDFNADGKADLAVANAGIGYDSLSVLLGDGSGSFAAAVNFSVGATPTSITSADFNADGKADLASSNFHDNNVSVLLNCNFTGVKENTIENSATLSPNPNNGNFTINSLSEIKRIEISNVAGQLLFLKLNVTKNPEINLNNFDNGIYFVKIIYTNGITITKKAIIN